MAGSDGARPPERPGGMLRPRQSAIRLRRQCAISRTSSRPSEPTVGGSVGGETAERAPSGPSRSASISVPGTFGYGGSAGAGARRSNRLREPSALTPALPEEPHESEEGGGDESPKARADDDKAGKPGILSRLRWNSDTNLQAGSQPTDVTSEEPNRQTTDQHEYDDQIVNLLDAIGKFPPSYAYPRPRIRLTTSTRSRSEHAILYHERPELPLRPAARTIHQQETCL